MPRRVRRTFRPLLQVLAERFSLLDPADEIRSGWVLVDGKIVLNPDSLVPADASIRIVEARPLRGERKLQAALDAFRVPVAGRVALDVGAAAGGFTRVLLRAGARLVYAVDAGHGQLVGSLRQHPRVRTLEATNLADLDPSLVPETVELLTMDLSYLAVAEGVPQLERIRIASGGDLIALVKPMFELGLPRPPEDRRALDEAVRRAAGGLEKSRWSVRGWIESPVRGARGAREFLMYAHRRRGP